MREQLNNNPVVKLAVVAVLLLGTVFFILSTMGGKGGAESEEEPAPTSTSATIPPAGEAAAVGPSATASMNGLLATAPPPPPMVVRAWDSGRTTVLLFVRGGGIDDRLVRDAADGLSAVPDVATFVVPAAKISRYASITEGVGVDRVPALVVITPKKLDKGIPTASVHYGYQSPASVIQAVVDAGYRGRTLDYHP